MLAVSEFHNSQCPVLAGIVLVDVVVLGAAVGLAQNFDNPVPALVTEKEQGPADGVNRQVDQTPAPARPGVFREGTKAATERFQANAGLPASGEVDALTWKALDG